ncbi:MAG TPA: metallopeptidase family protein [Verrucomicrobiae bacterium]|nr:metallopeptidase family protein [Verrucomicrobiae bacterium]
MAEERLMTDHSDPESASEMVATARKTLYALIARLPEELRAEALRVGYDLRKRCTGPGGEKTLGDYTRLVVPVITLYVETIKNECVQDGSDFEREIEITYLHEFGHHLGLDEGDLVKRGL